VGNALNSVSVSVQLLQNQLAGSRLTTLSRVVALLDDHKHNLGEFFADDPRGEKVALMLSMLDGTLHGEHDAMRDELVRLRASFENVGAAVSQLQATADDKGLVTLEAPEVVLGEAVALIRERSGREGIAVATESQAAPGARIDKHKTLDILTGLLGNALDALAAAPTEHKQVTVQLRGGASTVELQVVDNGAGIASEDLVRITTKPDRRGASLHRLANLASSAGGSLTATSSGPGRGATFTLALPNRGEESA